MAPTLWILRGLDKRIHSMETILIIDDDPVVAQVVATVLRRKGYLVLEARNMADALTVAESPSRPIDLLIVDHSISKAANRNAVERIRRNRPQTKVLWFSGNLESELRKTGEIPPESAFLQKPFQLEQLREQVRCLLEPNKRASAH